VDCIDMAHRDQWRAVVNEVIKLRRFATGRDFNNDSSPYSNINIYLKSFTNIQKADVIYLFIIYFPGLGSSM